MAEGRSLKTALLLLTENQSIMTKERIDELIAKDRLSQSEKQEIEAAVEESGVNVKINKGCRACYDKALAALYEYESGSVKMNDERGDAFNVSKDGWRLKTVTTAFRFGSKVFNNSTIAGVEVGKLHPIIRDTYFVKAEKDEQDS